MRSRLHQPLLCLIFALSMTACMKTESSNLRTPKSASLVNSTQKSTDLLKNWNGQSDLKSETWIVEDIFSPH